MITPILDARHRTRHYYANVIVEILSYEINAKSRCFLMENFAARNRLVDKSTNEATLIDFKNSHSRERVTKDQLVIYQIGLEKSRDVKISRGGYLLYNPRLQEWKWFKLYDGFRRQLLQRLAEATEDVQRKEFPHKWNSFTCMRFCDVRFSCEMFQSMTAGSGRR